MNDGTQHKSPLPSARWVFFRDFHLAPLDDVRPEALNRAAQQACGQYRDRKHLELTTAQNFLASKLGAKGGLAGFKREFDLNLNPFMQAHGLLKRADLITPRHDFPLVELAPRQIADRLFLSGRPLPQRVFTGYDVDWYELNNRFYRSNPWRDYQERHGKLFFLPFDLTMQECDRLRAESLEAVAQCLDAAIAACAPAINPPVNNLLGDQLLQFGGTLEREFRFVPKLYQPASCQADKFREEVRCYHDVAKLFREWIGRRGNGWVEILRYNESLIFLKGCGDSYDFLVSGFRDGPFEHNPFSPYLKNDDVPKSNDAYHFQRWLYFEYSGWLEEDEHHSEMEFYAGGKQPIDYPRPDLILRTHLITVGKYRPPQKLAPRAEGYYPFKLGGRLLCISNLVSIVEFRAFMERNPEYADYSRKPDGVDRWEPVNSDLDQTLPASVTWYDANAYASWVSRVKGLPVRLLTADEYIELAASILGPPPEVPKHGFFHLEHDRLCRFTSAEGSPISGHPPYMPEEDFQRLRLNFIPEAMKWNASAEGLRFLISPHFGEWMNEESAVLNTLTRTNIREPLLPPSRGFTGQSTGKYISKKIGFRLCFLGSPDQANGTTVTSIAK